MSDGVKSSELREETVLAHGVLVKALGMLGALLVSQRPDDWHATLQGLSEVDWQKRNAANWQGRVLHGRKIDARDRSVRLAANLLAARLGLRLDARAMDLETELPAEQRIGTMAA